MKEETHYLRDNTLTRKSDRLTGKGAEKCDSGEILGPAAHIFGNLVKAPLL